jgi:hypothetical protein
MYLLNTQGGLMSDQYLKNEESLEWLDALEIGFDLSDYQEQESVAEADA